MVGRRSYFAGILAGVATLLLHGLFISAAIWGGNGLRGVPDRPESIGSGANTGRAEGELLERRIVVRFLSPVVTKQSASDAHLSDEIRLAWEIERPLLAMTQVALSIG